MSISAQKIAMKMWDTIVILCLAVNVVVVAAVLGGI